VAKAMDYGQWQYENKKKQQEAKKKQHIIQVKELKFRPNNRRSRLRFQKEPRDPVLAGGQSCKGGGAVSRARNRPCDLGRNLLMRFVADLKSGAVEGQPRWKALRPRHHQPGKEREEAEKPKSQRG